MKPTKKSENQEEMVVSGAMTRYLELATRRQTFLDMARRCAEMTIPYLLTRSGTSENATLREPWQSVGARGVNVMASKLLLSVMPPSTSFFKLQINDGEFVNNPELNAAIKSEVDQVLARSERIVNQHISETQDRAVLFGAFKHLVTTGNVLAFMPDNESLRIYPLNRYVVDREGGEKAHEILTVEVVKRSELNLPGPVGVSSRSNNQQSAGVISETPMSDDEVEVFTWVRYDTRDEMWRWHQEALGQKIPNTEGQAKDQVCPWLPLRFNRVDGEDYGRGRIEEYLGDLRSLDSLMQSLVEGAAGSAKLIWMISPSATVTPNTLAACKNNAIITGRRDDVSVVQAQKAADLAVAEAMIQRLTQRLDEAFLVFSPRQSERTTAEEIRATQQELNEQLGGNMSNITVDLLQPYLRRKLFLLRQNKQLPPLPEGLVLPTIVTGLDGIGRGQDREALLIFATTVAQTLGPQALSTYLHPTEFVNRLLASVGVDGLGLVKTAEELQQESARGQEEMEKQSMLNQVGQLANAEVKSQEIQQNAAAAEQQPASGG
jgi:hypothetical protein